jgi:hypothetical protein
MAGNEVIILFCKDFGHSLDVKNWKKEIFN